MVDLELRGVLHVEEFLFSFSWRYAPFCSIWLRDIPIGGAGDQEFLMGSLAHQTPLVQHQNLVGGEDRAHPLGDDELGGVRLIACKRGAQGRRRS